MRVQLINYTSFSEKKKTLSAGFFFKKTIHLVNSAQWSMAPLLKFLSHHEKQQNAAFQNLWSNLLF
jgi:hypothetical protein